MRHMDAHLMGTAGFEAAFDERGAVQRLDRTVMGDRMLAAARCDDRHLLAVGRRAAERRVDGAVRGYRTPVRERQIAAVDAVRGELFGKAFRSEERRVGKECVSTCRSRWSPDRQKKKIKQIKKI